MGRILVAVSCSWPWHTDLSDANRVASPSWRREYISLVIIQWFSGEMEYAKDSDRLEIG